MARMSFQDRLRRLREERGLTWYRLAKLSGITKEGLAKLEQPGSDPKLSTLRKLAAALGVTVEELVRGETEKPKRKKGK
jgi:transcriptional regulator with XRE-family HTH domain